MASDLIPIDGIVHECNTSFDEISIRVGVIQGIIILLFVTSVRILFDVKREEEMFFSPFKLE